MSRCGRRLAVEQPVAGPTTRSRIPAQRYRPPDHGLDDVPPFTVVALGPRGAGRRCSSRYHELQIPSSSRSYFLTAPFEQVVLLNQWFPEGADTAMDGPSGTAVAETRGFAFTVRTRAPSGTVHPVLRLEYLDYAGGLRTDAQAPGSTARDEIGAQLRSSHALVGLLDGLRIRQAFDARREGQRRLQQSLTAMIGFMMMPAVSRQLRHHQVGPAARHRRRRGPPPADGAQLPHVECRVPRPRAGPQRTPCRPADPRERRRARLRQARLPGARGEAAERRASPQQCRRAVGSRGSARRPAAPGPACRSGSGASRPWSSSRSSAGSFGDGRRPRAEGT